jgi:two-component system, LytTR family, sensor kinase
MNVALNAVTDWKQKSILLNNRWLWHLLFWIGFALFRFWPYYITINHYPAIFLEYMLLSEMMLAAVTYFTIWLYKKLFIKKQYLFYFAAGVVIWIAFIYGRTQFQFYYLRNEPGFQRNTFEDIFFNSITFVITYFLFVTSCKFFKDGYIAQQFETERKQQQLAAEIKNLKSQIAPHFLFNTLNNLYGLAVEKSDKLPDLMLRLSDLLRHSLYETQKPLVLIGKEMDVLKSYIQLETVRLEDDLQLEFKNTIHKEAPYQIAPLILIVFIENAFKHAKSVQSQPVNIYIETSLEDGWFSLKVRNNYNKEKESSSIGIGLTNVKRRLELLYPENELTIIRDELFYTVYLQLRLTKADQSIVQNGN